MHHDLEGYHEATQFVEQDGLVDGQVVPQLRRSQPTEEPPQHENNDESTVEVEVHAAASSDDDSHVGIAVPITREGKKASVDQEIDEQEHDLPHVVLYVAFSKVSGPCRRLLFRFFFRRTQPVRRARDI